MPVSISGHRRSEGASGSHGYGPSYGLPCESFEILISGDIQNKDATYYDATYLLNRLRQPFPHHVMLLLVCDTVAA